MKYSVFIIFLMTLVSALRLSAQEDPYLWMEEVDGAKSMEFVNRQNKLTMDRLTITENYQPIYEKTLQILNSKDKIAAPEIIGKYIYNFWQDENHVRGIWRRATKQSYLSGTPDWDVLLDLDAMSAKDNVKYVYKGASGLYPDYNLFLVSLSKGGGDATVIKEFDAGKKTFVDNGFVLQESKGGASYIDQNMILVERDFGEKTMTTSGYPKQVKIWKRGTSLENASMIFEGKATDVSSGGYLLRDGENKYVMIQRGITFYTSEKFVRLNNKLIRLDVPEDADLSGILKNQLLVLLKSDWSVNNKTYKQGSLISLNFRELIKGNKISQLIYEPDEFSGISGTSVTKNNLLLNIMSNVKNELFVYAFNNEKWNRKAVKSPGIGTISIGSTDEFTDDYFFYFTNFLNPSTLYFGNATNGSYKKYKSLPAYFDGNKYKVEQFKATSTDGTMIPYFVVSPINMKLNGANPTLLYAYGGFEIPMQPAYSATTGTSWLERGGVYVLANIRGGGEFGPKWHNAGLKEKRQNVYNDFYSVAEDIIRRKITSPQHLGIQGGSNGGLLMGVALTQRPELYNAVVCQVPLLDMKRYNKLLAGASWMGEYGDPDKPEEWEYIKKYSPYHNLKTGVKYPEVFFYTSTRDDRVHPGHARKMANKMIDMGYPVLYYENIEGGHGGSSTNEQRARATALQFSYLLDKLK